MPLQRGAGAICTDSSPKALGAIFLAGAILVAALSLVLAVTIFTGALARGIALPLGKPFLSTVAGRLVFVSLPTGRIPLGLRNTLLATTIA